MSNPETTKRGRRQAERPQRSRRRPERPERSRRLVSAAEVREMLGISDVTLWRWINDPEVGFPPPVTIRRVRYWGKSRIDAFIERQFGEPTA